MWESEKARNEAIRRMLEALPTMARLWDGRGPTAEAVELIAAGGGPLSSGERVMLKAAFDLWNGTGRCTIDELLSTLDSRRLRAVTTALLARDGGEDRTPKCEYLGCSERSSIQVGTKWCCLRHADMERQRRQGS